MYPLLSFTVLLIISYFIGCFSTAKIFAKYFRNINIYKVGSGHSDTQNIFHNVDKPLGVFVGLADMGKMYFYLVLLKYILNIEVLTSVIGDNIGTQQHLLILGFITIIGHCLPITHHLKGGRGIFTYIGFVFFFAPEAILIVTILATIIVIFFKQIRFAQFMIVMLPPFINFFFVPEKDLLAKMFIAALLMGIINVVVSKKLGEI